MHLRYQWLATCASTLSTSEGVSESKYWLPHVFTWATT